MNKNHIYFGVNSKYPATLGLLVTIMLEYFPLDDNECKLFEIVLKTVMNCHPSCGTWVVYKRINTNHISSLICLAYHNRWAHGIEETFLPSLMWALPGSPTFPQACAHRVQPLVSVFTGTLRNPIRNNI